MFRARLAVAATVVALTLSGCGSASTAGTAPSAGGSAAGELTVYNAQHEDLVAEMVAGFTAATGIKVTLRNGDDSELGNQLVQEGKASPADVFLTENSPAMDLVDQAGLFAPLPSTTLGQVPAQFVPGTRNWTGWAARATVFAYNPTKVAAASLPASLMDLAKPEWKGRVGISPGGADFQAIVSAVLTLEGADKTQAWLDALKVNAKIYEGNGAIMKAVNAGQVDAGVIYHYYWVKDRAESGANSRNVELHYFGKQDPGAFLSVSGAGVLASSRRSEAAQKFVQYLSSPAGQQILTKSTALEYAIGNGVTPNPALKPLSELQAPTVDPGSLNGATVVQMLQKSSLI